MNGAPEAVFFSVIAVLTAVSLWRELPLQYVITVAAVMYGIAALWYLLLREPCWWPPLIVVNSRGLSRLILYKWREREYYGWWLMGLTCVLSTILTPRWNIPDFDCTANAEVGKDATSCRCARAGSARSIRPLRRPPP